MVYQFSTNLRRHRYLGIHAGGDSLLCWFTILNGAGARARPVLATVFVRRALDVIEVLRAAPRCVAPLLHVELVKDTVTNCLAARPAVALIAPVIFASTTTEEIVHVTAVALRHVARTRVFPRHPAARAGRLSVDAVRPMEKRRRQAHDADELEELANLHDVQLKELGP